MLEKSLFRSLVAVSSLAVMAFASVARPDTFGTGANQFSIDFVTISGSTNPASGYGIVADDYRMGMYEITNDQWDKFVANLGAPVTGNPTDAYDQSAYYTGSNVPTDSVSWYEAAQFVNWLNTSTSHQAAYKFTGTKGTSDYTLATWSAAEAAGGTNLYRHKDAFYVLPTTDEWVKAAYWNGTTLQDYATKAGQSLFQGNGSNGGWNYFDNGSTVIDPPGPWTVGNGSEELNGTYNMMGNNPEWTESPTNASAYETWSQRDMLGGGWADGSSYLHSSLANYSNIPWYDAAYVGFRVASVPEPGSITLLVSGLLGCLIWWRRKK